MHASTDDIKAELISKRIKETGETQGQAFKSIEKEASTEFYNQINKMIDEVISNTEYYGFAIFMDRNLRPSQFSELKNELSLIKEKLNQSNISLKVVGLVPDCMLGKDDNPANPFSFNYLLQTYLRIHLRKDHPTIVQNDWYLKPVQISCHFFKQFEKVEFIENDNKCVCVDHKTNLELEFDEFLYLTFTYESTNFSPPQSFIDCANAILNSHSYTALCEDETLLEHFYNCVEFYRDVFNFKEGAFNKEDLKAVMSLIDSKGPLLKIIRRKSTKSRINTLNLDGDDNRENIDEPEIISNLNIADNTHSYGGMKDIRISEEEKFSSTFEQDHLYTVVESANIQTSLNQEEDNYVNQKQLEDNDEEVEIVTIKKINDNKPKLKYYSIVYLGLKVIDDNPNMIIDQFCQNSISKLAEKYENLNDIAEQFSDLINFGWKRAPNPYHIRSLFEDQIEECALRGFFIVENFIMIAFLFPKSVPIESKVPHMTLYFKDGKPCESYLVIKDLLSKEHTSSNDPSEVIISNFFKESQQLTDECGEFSITLSKDGTIRKCFYYLPIEYHTVKLKSFIKYE